jgi:hypothetical protein
LRFRGIRELTPSLREFCAAPTATGRLPEGCAEGTMQPSPIKLRGVAMNRQRTMSSLTRRRFLRQAAVTGASILGAPAVLSARSPNEKLAA